MSILAEHLQSHRDLMVLRLSTVQSTVGKISKELKLNGVIFHINRKTDNFQLAINVGKTYWKKWFYVDINPVTVEFNGKFYVCYDAEDDDKLVDHILYCVAKQIVDEEYS